MKEIELLIQMRQYAFEELSADDRELVDSARRATHNAYARYSHFYVGAALRLQNGDIVIGANQENAAFPSGLCAERSAIFAAQSQQPQQAITALAISARNDRGFLQRPITPCGACRQVVLEMEDRYQRPVRFLLDGTSSVYEIKSIKDLLPLSFVDENMH